VIELDPKTYFAPLDLLAIFGREAPLHVDLGCGGGDFLCELAGRHPERNFLGIEKLAGRVAKACRKSAHLENVRIFNVESAYAVRYLLPKRSVEIFYLLFPDPWPKRRHHRRRIVTTDFFDAIYRALSENGIFQIATDQPDYFHLIRETADSHRGFETTSPAAELPTTKFERRFAEAGAAIYRLSLRKTSPVT
jgi:tRNA (guanine-N7-)-methyltransferase